MQIDALVVSADAATVDVLRRVLQEAGMTVTRASTPEEARAVLSATRFDTVVVDCDDLHGGRELVRHVRREPSSRSSIIFCITHSSTTIGSAFDLGANFVLEKPVADTRAERSVRAAYGLIVRERRRYLRQTVDLPATLTLGDSSRVNATLMNLSEGGMAIRCDREMQEGASLRVSFTLPGVSPTLEARAEVAWIGPQHRAGLRFVFVGEEVRRAVGAWLEAQFALAPEPVLMNVHRALN